MKNAVSNTLMIAGPVAITYGVYNIFGIGAASISAGLFLVGYGVLIALGMKNAGD